MTESKNKDGELYGEKRLVDFVQANGKIELENLVKSIWNDIAAFSHSEIFDDDVTCVLVKIDKELSRSALSTESELEITSDLKELERVRVFIRKFCAGVKDSSLDAKRISMIELAATEVTVNIIKHAYQSRSGETIQINAEASADEIEIRFYDKGEQFDPELVPQPVFDGSREGGFGLHIITHTVDEVLYSRDEQGRNCSCLKIKL